jgi:hypothetical protein
LKSVKTFFVKRQGWLWLGVAGSIVVLSFSAIHLDGQVKQPQALGPMVGNLAMPAEVRALVKRSCADCHSNETVWPWYSYVAPVSWLVERDVRHGRDHMNLSRWPEYSLNQQEKLLADIASALKNREMPLANYALMHRDARLSDAEIDIAYRWARLERRRLKAASAGSVAKPVVNSAIKP